MDEDTYTTALSQIIARDFFPGLAETEAQHEYLDAHESRDPAWIQSAGERLVAVMTPGARGRRGTSLATPQHQGLKGTVGETPRGWVGETPRTDAEDGSKATRQSRVDTNMTLGAFQSKYTSEDNESFNNLLDKQNEQRQEKYGWLWNGNQLPSKRQIAQAKYRERIEAEARDKGLEAGEIQQAIVPADMRKAMPETWQSRPNNNLIFGPAGIEDEMQTVQQKAEEDSRAGPKAVVYANTRMPLPIDAEMVAKVPESPSLSAVNDAIAGRPRLSTSELGEQSVGDTPRVKGYAFVDSEPSPEPEVSLPNTRDFSNISLGPGDATPNPFTVKERSSREDLHYRMVDKVAKSKRAEQLASQTRTPVPRFMSSPRPGKDGLTPAAQRLLGNVGSKTPVGSIWEGSGTPRTRSSLGTDWIAKPKTPHRSAAS